MAYFHKIMYVCISHAVLDSRKVFLMCNGIVFECFGVLWGIFQVVWGVSSETYFTTLVKPVEQDKFSNLENSTIFNSEIHCFHGLEELISYVTWVEIPPLYAKLHRLDT